MQLAAATPCSAPAPSIENQLGQPSSSPGHFVKDGRVIEIGDCALFRSGDSPPFIGIILSFLQNYENAPDKTKSSKFLSVNWLYRPSDVKLSRGNLLEAAPNEVFYSFHKDIVPADSLLHPCKVSFLRKGIDLKNGVSSFVCRRVYDIEHKRLWWLTDKNYINERQAEVNKLLDRTQSEMNTSPQQGSSGNRQSKSSLKSPRTGHQTGQDDSNGFPSSFLSHSNSNKTGRKRDPLSVQPIKRDPDPFASAIEEDNSNKNDREISVQSEISKITEMGGLTSIEAVEKLLNLMQSDRTERKLELTGRIKLAGIIAGSDPSDKNEALLKFVQMRGVGILDEWLQEAHKGTKDDISNNNNNKGIEELLLALLHALEKLPINLSALRMCNIGKSVNHLRGHKNVEVQKKARFLVDTWKRRVDAEMKANELKSGLVQLATSKSVHSKSGNEPDNHSPNSSSSFGSGKPGSGSANKITCNKMGTRPVTRSTDAGRLNMPLAAGSGGSSPVHVNQVQAGKMKKCEEKEELVGFEEDSSEVCAGTGTTSVSVPAGDDLGMLASVAAEEMTKSEPKEEEMTNADAIAIAIASNDNENDDVKNDDKNEGEKIDKDNETEKIDKSNKNEKEELDSSEKVPESDVKPKEGNSEKANNIKQENKEKEPVPVTKSAKEENTEDPLKPENNNPAGGTTVDKNETSNNPPKQETKPIAADVAQGCVSTSVPRESISKVEFDLNEGLEESPLNTDSDLGPKSTSNFAASLNPPFAPKFTVGPFLSQENLLRPIKSEVGRVGSGPISAFRPAEPRRGLEISIGLKPVSDDVAKRPVLEFDLNVPDERLLEETMGSNGFELDLNRMDGDAGPSGLRGFDLNGPGLGMDECGTGTGAGTSAENLMSRNQFVPRGGLIGMTGGGNSSIPFLPQNTGLRMMNNNSDPGHIWFPQSGTGPYQVSNPFGATSMYRLPGNNAVLYPGQQSQSQFPFGFPPGQTPYQSMVGAGLSLSQRPYFINLPEGSGNSNSGGSGQGKWVPVGRPGVGPGLDLNGPGSGVEYVVHVDQVLAGAGKRKEPEGGWDKDRDRERFSGGAAAGNSSNKQFWQ